MKNLILIVGLCIFFFSCKTEVPKETVIDPLVKEYDSTLWPFYHGVASGDPLPDRVIIWTRVTPHGNDSTVSVQWEIAEDSTFNSIYKSGAVKTSNDRDFTVKVDVDALQPGQMYYYRFKTLDKTSITGRTKTASIGNRDSLQFAVVSCSSLAAEEAKFIWCGCSGFSGVRCGCRARTAKSVA